MKLGKATVLAILPLAAALWLGGCSDENCVECVDHDPPAVPTGVYSITGDGRITVLWNDIYQSDLAGYAVYRDDNADGQFERLADIAWDENFDQATGLHHYVDTAVTNGLTYDYAVASFDGAGNESLLSFEQVFDTPRPEGFDVDLFDRLVTPAASGFDFSGGSRVANDDATADIYVEWAGDIPFVYAARADVELQDYGNVMTDSGFIDLDLLSYAPLEGWTATRRVEAIRGHAYVVRVGTSVYHYAKFAVMGLDGIAGSVTVDWAYQTDTDNRELKAPPAPVRRGDVAEVMSF
ncbi:MAG: hypothetical protein ACYDIE_07625 [Candidatus Krumholzibacteriia bacterium]